MVLGAKHVPLADCPSDFSFEGIPETALAEDGALILSPIVGRVAFAGAAGSGIHEIYLGKIVPNKM
jgi:hypothetical protein